MNIEDATYRIRELEDQLERFLRYAVLIEDDLHDYADKELIQDDWDAIVDMRTRMQGEAPEDDDPQCVCGVHRSEHAMMGCPEGFQTAKQWEAEKEFIWSLDDWQYERIYGEG